MVFAHCFSPLVEEKLDLEGEAMSSIQTKQDETDDELRQTLRRLAATDQKTAEAQGKAAQERGLIKQDVDVVRNELNAVRFGIHSPNPSRENCISDVVRIGSIESFII